MGEGSSGLVVCGLASGACFGDGNSCGRLLLAFTVLLSLAAFAFSFAPGEGDVAALALALLFALVLAFEVGLRVPPRGIPFSF